MRALVRDAAVILVAVLVLGTASNIVRARHLAWWGAGQEPPTAGKDYQLVDAGSADALRTSLPRVVFFDTRSAAEFASGHVPGAEPIAYTDLDRRLTSERVARLRGADVVVVYGASEETDIEQLVAQELRRRGLPPPSVIVGGFQAWVGAGLPVDGGSAP